MGKVLIILAAVVFVSSVFGATSKNTIKNENSSNAIDGLLNKEVDKTIDSKQLSDAFMLMSKYTDLQRDLLLKEITNKVIEWNIVIYEVKKVGDKYIIQGGISESNPFMNFVISPRNNEDVIRIQKVMTGESMIIRGTFTGSMSFRTLEVKPAILISSIENKKNINSSKSRVDFDLKNIHERDKSEYLLEFADNVRYGKGEVMDKSQAAYLYRIAALDGDYEAQYQLGLMFLEGEGVPLNLREAYMWLDIANSQSGEVKEKDLVATKMTLQQSREVQKKAAECDSSSRQSEGSFRLKARRYMICWNPSHFQP